MSFKEIIAAARMESMFVADGGSLAEQSGYLYRIHHIVKDLRNAEHLENLPELNIAQNIINELYKNAVSAICKFHHDLGYEQIFLEISNSFSEIDSATRAGGSAENLAILVNDGPNGSKYLKEYISFRLINASFAGDLELLDLYQYMADHCAHPLPGESL